MNKTKYITRNEVKGSLLFVFGILLSITPSILFFKTELVHKILIVTALFVIFFIFGMWFGWAIVYFIFLRYKENEKKNL